MTDRTQPPETVDPLSPLPVPAGEIVKALRVAFTNDHSDEYKQVMHWIRNGGDLRWKSPNGWTLLHLAAQCGNPGMIKYLVEQGSDVEAADESGETPLMLACDTGYARVQLNHRAVEALLACGANPDARDFSGRTVMNFLGEWGSFPEAQQITTIIINEIKKRNAGKPDGAINGDAGIDSGGKKWWCFWK